MNIHWHGEHTQGNLHLGYQAQIIAHHNVDEGSGGFFFEEVWIENDSLESSL